MVANRASSEGSRTFGLFRLEILASLVNAILTFAVAGYVLVEAAIRLVDGDSDVEAGPMLVVAIAGLAVNLVVFLMLRDGAQDSLAVRGAYVDAMADAAGSVGVIVAAVVIETTGWDPIDPIVAAVIGVWILPRAWRLAPARCACCCRSRPRTSTSTRSAPSLLAMPGVVDVHDLHVWTLTSEMDVASAHVMIGPGTDPHGVLDQARVLLLDHEIAHATIQVEPDDHAGAPSSTGDGRGRVGGAGRGAGGRAQPPRAAANPTPSPRVRSRAPGERGGERAGDLRVAERGDVGEPARDEQEDRRHQHQRHRGVDPLRHIHSSASTPSAIPPSEYALCTSLVPAMRCSRPRGRSRARPR